MWRTNHYRTSSQNPWSFVAYDETQTYGEQLRIFCKSNIYCSLTFRANSNYSDPIRDLSLLQRTSNTFSFPFFFFFFFFFFAGTKHISNCSERCVFFEQVNWKISMKRHKRLEKAPTNRVSRWRVLEQVVLMSRVLCFAWACRDCDRHLMVCVRRRRTVYGKNKPQHLPTIKMISNWTTTVLSFSPGLKKAVDMN